jgi:hypothetical protein
MHISTSVGLVSTFEHMNLVPVLGTSKKLPNQPDPSIGSFLKLSYQSTRPGIGSKTDFWLV